MLISSFNDCQPSLGAVIASENELNPQNIKSVIERINHVQKYFRNACAIIIRKSENDWWTNFQSHIEPGTIKLFFVNNELDCSRVLQCLHEKLDNRNNESFRKQSILLERQREQNESYATSISIIRESFEEMGIEEKDVNAIIETYRSISRIINEAGKQGRSNVVVSPHSMEAIKRFFYAPVPDLKVFYKAKFG